MKAPKVAKAAGTAGTAVSANRPAAIAWPALPTPAQRSQPIEIEETLDSQILLVHGFLPRKTCTTWTNFLSDPKNLVLEPSPPAKRGEAARTNHRFSSLDDTFAASLWEETGLSELVLRDENASIFQSSEKPGAKPIGLNPNIRIYRYEPGQAFAPHYDDTVKVGKNHTEWTLLIYLSGSDEVEGGETAFYPCGVAPDEGSRKRKIRPGEEDVVVELRKGMALLHRHGRECLLHAGLPVRKGVKWVLRSDVVLA